MPITIPALARTDFLDGRALIDGRWVEGPEPIAVDNPATGGVIATVSSADRALAEQAVIANRSSLAVWRAMPAAARADLLLEWHRLVLDARPDLGALITAEGGKPLAEALGEVDYAASFIRWFAEEARRIYGEILPPLADRRLLVLKRPVGVVGAITPWNFPAAMITRKVAPALAAGCTLTLKPSELTPLTALALGRLALEAGIPAGVFNVVPGPAGPIGEVLTMHPDVAKFTFTGSTRVGTMLSARCAETMKRVSMELGGNAPLIVFDDADLETAVAGTIASKFRNAGQTCVCANRILVQSGIHDRFVEALTARVAAMTVGNGLEAAVDIGPLISDAAIAKVDAHVADALAHGARPSVGGARSDAGARFYRPTVLVGATSDMRLADEETFGPVAPIFRFSGEAEAFQLANATPYGLAAYAFSADHGRFWRLAEGIDAGMIGINIGLVSTEVAPFGGVKQSGLGREGSHFGIEEYLEVKAIHFAVAGAPAAG
jgi:succinate-semialdehyde dehydrogenase/glutarate-semialdehyde dehydrogenase